MSKLIVVPKNKLAMEALDYNNVTDDQILELTLNESQFDLLWNAGIFDEINSVANVLIDAYEDEKIVGKWNLEWVISKGIFDKQYYNTELRLVLEQIKGLFMKAIEFDTGVFFYF